MSFIMWWELSCLLIIFPSGERLETSEDLIQKMWKSVFTSEKSMHTNWIDFLNDIYGVFNVFEELDRHGHHELRLIHLWYISRLIQLIILNHNLFIFLLVISKDWWIWTIGLLKTMLKIQLFFSLIRGRICLSMRKHTGRAQV